MKVSCLPVSLFNDIADGKMTVKQWAHEAKTIGYDGIDLSVILLKNHTPVYLNRVKKDLYEEEISINMITTYPDFTNPSELQRECELEYLRHDIALCSNLEAKYLRITAGQAYPETPREAGIGWTVENFKKIEPVAEKYNVQLLFEDHAKPGAWDYIDFSHPTDIFLEICEKIEALNIRINFDTGNIVAYGDDPLEVLKLVYDKVETIHASDVLHYGKFEPVLLGTGCVPLKEILKFLKKNGFDGWICIEECSNTGLAGVKKAYDYIKNNWKEVV